MLVNTYLKLKNRFTNKFSFPILKHVNLVHSLVLHWKTAAVYMLICINFYLRIEMQWSHAKRRKNTL